MSLASLSIFLRKVALNRRAEKDIAMIEKDECFYAKIKQTYCILLWVRNIWYLHTDYIC